MQRQKSVAQPPNMQINTFNIHPVTWKLNDWCTLFSVPRLSNQLMQEICATNSQKTMQIQHMWFYNQPHSVYPTRQSCYDIYQDATKQYCRYVENSTCLSNNSRVDCIHSRFLASIMVWRTRTVWSEFINSTPQRPMDSLPDSCSYFLYLRLLKIAELNVTQHWHLLQC